MRDPKRMRNYRSISTLRRMIHTDKAEPWFGRLMPFIGEQPPFVPDTPPLGGAGAHCNASRRSRQ
jgi:hypothetical protein